MLNEWNHLLMDVVWVVVGIGALYALHKMLMPHGDATKFFLSAEGIAIVAIIAPFAKHEINFRPSGVIEGPIRPGMTLEAIFYVLVVLVGSILILYLYKKLLS